MNVDLVIERIGGGVKRQLALKLGVEPMVVQYWAKQGRIPRWWHARIREIAKQMNVEIES
jgi:hypothetical protein